MTDVSGIPPVPPIVVTNVSPFVEEKDMRAFFGFCGNISSISFQKSWTGSDVPPPDASITCIIKFEQKSAADTALLLNHALIKDKSIIVKFQEEETLEVEVATDIITNESNPNPKQAWEGEPVVVEEDTSAPEDRTKTSVIASLLAAGYILGADTLQKAKAFDEKHGMSHSVKAKAYEVDDKYNLSIKATVAKNIASAKASQLGQMISDTSKQIDEKYHVAEKFNKTLENETVAKGLSALRAAKDKLTAKAYEIKEESSKLIEEKKQQKEQSNNPPPASDQDIHANTATAAAQQ